MKRLSIFLSIFTVLALLISGCGKTEEQMTAEKAEVDKVTAMHEEVAGSLAQIDEMAARFDAAMADTMTAKMAGMSDELMAAKTGLMAAKDAVAAWQMPDYDEKAKHEDVLASMAKATEELTAAKGSIEAAAAAANASLEKHSAASQAMMAEMEAAKAAAAAAKGGKKGKK